MWLRSLLLIPLLLLPALALAGSPALVTTARGAVQVVGGEDAQDAPTPPFVLEEGQLLKLADGALVVVLFEGHATQVSGPASVGHDAFKAQDSSAREGVDVLDELLGRHVSTAPAGASRASGDVILVRPVPGGAVTAPETIAWRCEACGDQDVAVVDLLTGETVWSGKGEGSVAYTGPALESGAYAVALRGRDFAFTVVDAAQRTTAKKAAEAARAAANALEGADAAARVSVEASVWLQAGLPTDALYAVDAALADSPDDSALSELRKTFERRAGLPP